MADRLATLMTHFPVAAQVFNAGALCGINAVEDEAGRGQLHLVREGAVEVRYGRESVQVDEPSLLLFARPHGWRFERNHTCAIFPPRSVSSSFLYSSQTSGLGML